MKKYLLTFIFVLLFLPSVFAVQTCVKNASSTSLCFDLNSDVYETGISYYEGLNDKYGLYIENPDTKPATWTEYAIDFLIPNYIKNNKIDINNLGDKTTFTFDSYQDFYNTLQQKNALGNVTLFTEADLNAQNRAKTSELTGEVVNWTYLLIIMIMEFTRIVIDVAIILLVIFLVFRGIPKALNFVKSMTIKFYVWSKK